MPTYDDALSDYISQHFAREDKHLIHTQEITPQKGLPAINIRPEEGKFLQFLVAAARSKKAIELGTLGGYSGIWIARGLAPGGKLISVEKSEKHAAVARENIAAAGLSDRVEILVGDAHQVIKKLAPQGPYDFVFIDAEKSGYDAYYDWAIENLREGGIIAAHNAFRHGQILEPQTDGDASLTDNFNRRIAFDPRVVSTIYPAGDGTLIAVKVA